jgi:uncharacterized membrane protein YqaE (UPF0057 family)
MRYLLAIFLPPVAVLLCGKPMSALINLLLCLLFFIPGIIHAWMVVKEYHQDKRTDKTITSIKASAAAQMNKSDKE